MTYERLTDKRLAIPKNAFRQATSKEEYLELSRVAYNTDNTEIYNRLSKLEDKIEKGILVELPCEVGKDIYYITDKQKIVHRIAREYRYLVDLGWEITATLWEKDRKGYSHLQTTIIHSEEIGKTAFFDIEKAKEKLKELQNGRND